MRWWKAFAAAVIWGAMMAGRTALAEEGKMKEGVEQVGQFAVDWLPRMEGENVVTSPYLISSAFAMLAEGARGRTLEQMNKVFHFPKDHAFSLIDDENKGGKEGVTVALRSMLFVDRRVTLEPAFLATAKERFRALVTAVDLLDPNAATGTINKAVARETHDRIKEAVSADKLKDTRTNGFVLANTLYFKGKWKTQFDPKGTKPAAFHGAGPLVRTVAMMELKGGYFAYGHFDGVQALKLPYAGEKYSLLILLPDASKGFSDLGKRPDIGHVQKTLAKMEPELVDLYLPRFSIADKHDLLGPLAAMGMGDAFGAAANFSGMKSASPGVYLSFATEEAVFAVDEEGTEAASAVTVGGGLFSDSGHHEPPKPIVFRVDHPCVMVLVEEATGMPMFMVGLSGPTEFGGK